MVTASNPMQWARVLTALAAGRADRSRFVHKGRGRRIDGEIGPPIPYELDGGARKATKRLHGAVEAGADHGVRRRGGPTVSTASLVPETFDLSGDDAWTTLSRGWGSARLLKDTFMRMRWPTASATPARIAFMTTLVAVQGVIGLVGLASLFGKGSIGTMVVATVRRAVPGAAGQVLASAVVQAHTTAVGAPVQRPCLRFDRISRHRDHGDGTARTRTQPALRSRAGPADSAEIRAGAGVRHQRRHPRRPGVRLPGLRPGDPPHRQPPAQPAWAIGRSAVGPGADRGSGDAPFPVVAAPPTTSTVLAVVRGGCVSAAMGCRHCRPRRVLPVQLVVWPNLRSARRSHRPSALWCLLSAVALLFGAAVAAQLESVRAGEPAPQDAEKVAESEPDADQTAVPVPS